jgi:Zn-finger nucleic acid-binding protein
MSYRDPVRACPHCGTELVAIRATRDKWRCPSCSGILVGGTELERELGTHGRELVFETKTGVRATRPCPSCKEPMTAFDLLGIELDRCDRDDLYWFDRAELGRARTAIGEAFVENLLS